MPEENLNTLCVGAPDRRDALQRRKVLPLGARSGPQVGNTRARREQHEERDERKEAPPPNEVAQYAAVAEIVVVAVASVRPRARALDNRIALKKNRRLAHPFSCRGAYKNSFIDSESTFLHSGSETERPSPVPSLYQV